MHATNEPSCPGASASIESLPNELLLEIFSWLSGPKEIAAASATCQLWREASFFAWRQHCTRRFACRSCTQGLRPTGDWSRHVGTLTRIDAEVEGRLEGRDMQGNTILHQEILCISAIGESLASLDLGAASPPGGISVAQCMRAIALIECGVELDAVNDVGRTALHLAARIGALPIVKAITAHPDRVQLSARCARGRTALAAAARAGHLAVVQWLHQSGVSVLTKENNGRTALHSAAKYGHLEVLKWLLEQGVDVDALSNCNRTALLLGARYGRMDVVLALAERGADCHVHERKDGNTPLLYAAVEQHADIVRWLLKQGVDPNSCNNMGSTPLHWSVRMGHTDIVQILIEHGADVNAPNHHQKRPLHVASRFGDPVIVENLLKAGATVNVADYRGLSPLHCAAEFGHLDVAKVLVMHGASRYAVDVHGQTPVVVAATLSRAELVTWLLTEAPALAARRHRSRKRGLQARPRLPVATERKAAYASARVKRREEARLLVPYNQVVAEVGIEGV